jgi:hypothetical protein
VFSTISAADLKHGTHTIIRENKYQTLTINCQAATVYGVRGIDNRAGTAGNDWYVGPYGLGVTAKGEKIGAHYLDFQMPGSTVDGKPAFVTFGTPDGSVWDPALAEDLALRNDGYLLGLTSTLGEVGPIAVKDASVRLRHFMVINDADTLTLNEEIMLDGSASIELVYL